MDDVCLICRKKADKYPKEKYLMGFCNNCLTKMKKIEKSSGEKKLATRLHDFNTKFQQLQEKMDIAIIKRTAQDNKDSNPQAIRKIKDIKKKKLSPSLNSSVRLKGEVRSISILDKKSPIQCPYCKLEIDKKLYFIPVVIHCCGNGYYHRECFAKLMAEGNYKCMSCNQDLFERV